MATMSKEEAEKFCTVLLQLLEDPAYCEYAKSKRMEPAFYTKYFFPELRPHFPTGHARTAATAIMQLAFLADKYMFSSIQHPTREEFDAGYVMINHEFKEMLFDRGFCLVFKDEVVMLSETDIRTKPFTVQIDKDYQSPLWKTSHAA